MEKPISQAALENEPSKINCREINPRIRLSAVKKFGIRILYFVNLLKAIFLNRS